MTQANMDIRKAIKEAKIHHWEIAEALSVSEMTLVRWLRKELSDEKKQLILTAIEHLKEENR